MLMSFIITEGGQHTLLFNTTGLCKENTAPAFKSEDTQLLDWFSAAGHNEHLRCCYLVPKYWPISINQARLQLPSSQAASEQPLVHGENKPETMFSQAFDTQHRLFLSSRSSLSPSLITLFSVLSAECSHRAASQWRQEAPETRGFLGNASHNFPSSNVELLLLSAMETEPSSSAVLVATKKPWFPGCLWYDVGSRGFWSLRELLDRGKQLKQQSPSSVSAILRNLNKMFPLHLFCASFLWVF